MRRRIRSVSARVLARVSFDCLRCDARPSIARSVEASEACAFASEAMSFGSMPMPAPVSSERTRSIRLMVRSSERRPLRSPRAHARS